MEQKISKTNRLDVLNNQFQNRKRRREKNRNKKIRFQSAGNKWVRSIILVIALVSLCYAGVFMSKSAAGGIRKIPNGVSGAEAEKWKHKEVDKEQFFIKLNTALTMKAGNQEANLSIMNPPYSAYNFCIKIVLENKAETLLYSSDLIKPGTYLETVEFQKGLSADSYKAMVYYTFFGDTQEVIIGEHAVPVTIEVRE